MGYAVQKGTELGLSLPTMETCYRLMAGINRSLQYRIPIKEDCTLANISWDDPLYRG